MNLLLDTHTVLWLAIESPNLPQTAIREILDPGNRKFVSMASAWEVAIKASVGRFDFPGISTFFDILDVNGFEIIPITRDPIRRVEGLPWIHRDPFDRLIVAAAVEGGMTVLSADKNIQRYPCVKWLW